MILNLKTKPLVFDNQTKQLVAKSFETVEIHNPIVSFVKQGNNFETISNHNSGAKPFDTVKFWYNDWIYICIYSYVYSNNNLEEPKWRSHDVSLNPWRLASIRCKVSVCFYVNDASQLKNIHECCNEKQKRKFVSVEPDLSHAIQKMIYLQYERVGFPSECIKYPIIYIRLAGLALAARPPSRPSVRHRKFEKNVGVSFAFRNK